VTQAEDRCHRIGQEESVLVQHLVLEGSLDATMARTIVEKQDVLDRALDREASVQWETPVTERPATARVKPDELAKAAEAITPSQVAAVHECLAILAGTCDGARTKDGCGFNKIDSKIGKSLALQSELTPRQAALGQRLIRKYRRQLGLDLLKQAGIEAK
jgi:hypothetical protein